MRPQSLPPQTPAKASADRKNVKLFLAIHSELWYTTPMESFAREAGGGKTGTKETKMKRIKPYIHPLIILFVFEAVAVTLWLSKNNLFYLLNFSYIGLSICLGMILFIRKYRHARRVVQLLVGLYMLVYLGLICQENM